MSRDGAVWTVVSTDAGRHGTGDYIHPDDLQSAMMPEQRAQRQLLQKQITDQNLRVTALRSE